MTPDPLPLAGPPSHCCLSGFEPSLLALKERLLESVTASLSPHPLQGIWLLKNLEHLSYGVARIADVNGCFSVGLISLSAVFRDSGSLTPSSGSPSSVPTSWSQRCWKGGSVDNRFASESLIPPSCNLKPSLSSAPHRTRTKSDSIQVGKVILVQRQCTDLCNGHAEPALQLPFRAGSFWKQTFSDGKSQ